MATAIVKRFVNFGRPNRFFIIILKYMNFSNMTKVFYFSGSVACSIALIMQGCSHTLTNITPSTMPQNPSNKYRLTLKSDVTNKDAIPDSFKAEVVIDGTRHELKQSTLGDQFFFHDHYIPRQYDEAAYYFVVNYSKSNRGNIRNNEIKSPLQKLKITDRMVFSLSNDRAPVGSKISVLGNGFRAGDRVIVGDFSATTEFVSNNVLSFVVPQMLPNKAYDVCVLNDQYKEFVGTILVDKAGLSVDVARIELNKGEHTSITISTDVPVSAQNLVVNITTNIPDSIIMPEVVIPNGQNSTTVNIEGGENGSGFLFIEAQGYDEIQLPITVTDHLASNDNLEAINQI